MGAEECTLCGLCKVDCPTFRALRTEADSPRGKAILIREKVDDPIFFMCNLCGACKARCPLGIDLGLKAHRQSLNGSGVQTKENKKMIENVKKFGNPYGNPDEGSDDIYCC